MSGEKDLSQLLQAMSPELIEGEFVFCTFEGARYGAHSELEPIGAFQESEGLTLIIPRNKADQYQIEYDSVYKGITLQVHSSLNAVGLTAAFSKALTEHSISANVVAGYFHDHIFVQAELAEAAMNALAELAPKQT